MSLLTLALTCAPLIHPDTTLRLVRTENARLNPYAINVNYGGSQLPRQPVNLAEAVAAVRNLRAAGLNFDAGLQQINSANWEKLRLTEFSVFDPCTNLAAGQVLLIDCFRRAPTREPQTALREALSCWNTGNHRRGFQNGYVARVVNAPPPLLPFQRNGSPPPLAVTRATDNQPARVSFPATPGTYEGGSR